MPVSRPLIGLSLGSLSLVSLFTQFQFLLITQFLEEETFNFDYFYTVQLCKPTQRPPYDTVTWQMIKPELIIAPELISNKSMLALSAYYISLYLSARLTPLSTESQWITCLVTWLQSNALIVMWMLHHPLFWFPGTHLLLYPDPHYAPSGLWPIRARDGPLLTNRKAVLSHIIYAPARSNNSPDLIHGII